MRTIFHFMLYICTQLLQYYCINCTKKNRTMPEKIKAVDAKRRDDMKKRAIFLFRSGKKRKDVISQLAIEFYLSDSRIPAIINITELNQKYSVRNAGEQRTANSTAVRISATNEKGARA